MQPAWIQSLENADWVLEHSEELLAFYGEEPFWADEPLAIQGDLSLQQDDPEAAAQAVVESFIQELGLPFEGATFSSLEEPGLYFDIDGSTLHLEIYSADLNSPLRMPAALAMALAGVFVSMQRPEPGQGWHEDEELPIMALLSILLGFGPFVCEAQLQGENQTSLPEADTGEEPSHSPFDCGLSYEECCFAQAYVCFTFDQDFPSFQSRFSESTRQKIGEALEYMLAQEAHGD